MKTNRLFDGLFLAAAGALLLGVSGCATPPTTIVVDPVAKSPQRYNKMFNRGSSKGATLVVYVPAAKEKYVDPNEEAPTCAETINVDAPSYSVESCQRISYGTQGGSVRMNDEPQPTPQPNHPGPHYIVVAFQAPDGTPGVRKSRKVSRPKRLPLVIIRTTPDTTDKPNAVPADPGDDDEEDRPAVHGTAKHDKQPHLKRRLILNFPGGFPEGEQGKPKIFRVRNTPVPTAP